MNIYDFKATSIKGEEIEFSRYKDKVLLIVNTASKCGFTEQYKELQELYSLFLGKLEILAFPCNQFGKQEPGERAEIVKFCELTFKVTFPIFDKIHVNGEKTHPLYSFLKEQAPGLLGSQKIKWNFTKFLIGRDGVVDQRFAPTTKPLSMKTSIEKLLTN